MNFTKDELIMLIDDGYKPGFMIDIREDDLVAIPPIVRTHYADGEMIPVKTLVVQRIIKQDASYWDEESDAIKPHIVVVFIGIDLDNLPEHCAYGSTYPCFIKREEA